LAKADAKFSVPASFILRGSFQRSEISKRLAIRVSNAGAIMGFALLYLEEWVKSIRPAINRQNENCGLTRIGECRRNCCPIVDISDAASMHVSAEDRDGSLTGHIFQCRGGYAIA
jgi:hypothetical protein